MASPAGIAAVVAVSIHVGPDVSPEFFAAAVRSCQAALGEGQCRLDEPGAPGASFQATVISEDERLERARIELRRKAEAPVLVTRELSFVPEDAPRERWASVGVLIAALVVARSREETEAARPVTLVPARRALPSRPRAPASAPAVGRLDLHALVSRRLTRGLPEFGAQFRGSVRPRARSWFGIGSITGARRPGTEPVVSWISVAAGLGARVGSEMLAAELSGGGVAEYWLMEASEPGRSERSGEFRTGGFGALEGLWAFHPRWILSFGVEGRLVTPRLRIDVSGSLVERVLEPGGFVFAGLRFIP